MAPSHTAPAVEPTGDTAPAGLLDAFWEYDRALLSNDVDALDAAFATSPATLRGDGTTLVTGHAAIARFRATRSVVPTRRVRSIAVQVVTENSALIVAEVASATGTTGMQTQLWRRIDSVWAVTAAHVTAPASPLDAATWRVVGAPLVPSRSSGPLDTHTVAVKDLFALEGHVIGGGVRQFAASASVETRTAPSVHALLDAGASVTGLAQTDQFAYSIAGINADYGTPLNIATPTRIPGGSTSGSASAVARGWCSIGLGTDTAGSIRVPAAFQGLWGIRATHGLVSTDGVLPLAPSFDAVGWITRDSATLARVGAVLIPTEVDADPADGAVTTLVTIDALNSLAIPGLRTAMDAALARLGAMPIALDADIEEWFASFRIVQAYEAWHAHGGWITDHPGSLGADVASRFAEAAAVTADDAEAARAVVVAARAHLRSALRGRTLVLPTTASLATPLGASPDTVNDERARTLRLTFLASIAGLPAVTAPVLTVDGVTAGLCFVGQERTDLHLINTARRSAELLND
jgi:amidase